MKFSARSRYGLRALIDLSLNSLNGPVTLTSIAERQDIPENYLEQIFSSLRKAGLIRSIKGAQGGYQLSLPAEKTSVGDVLRTLEGSLDLFDENPTGNSHIQQCLKGLLWDRMNRALEEYADSQTLQDLIDDFYRRGTNDFLMYDI